MKLAEKLDAAARTLGKNLDVLIEINVGGEAAKSGIALIHRNWMPCSWPRLDSRHSTSVA